jgi:predicted unusual protein kinase regulating ubiquinone biosynthesis (AarF/ABC1/UbiB family)
MQRHQMRPPPSITLLARSLFTLEGTLTGINPHFSLVHKSEEIVMADHRQALGTPQEILQREALRSLPALRTLPEHAKTLANQLRGGRLTVRTEHFAGADHDVVDYWVDRLVIALVAGFSVVGSALLLLRSGDDQRPRSQIGAVDRWLLGPGLLDHAGDARRGPGAAATP